MSQTPQRQDIKANGVSQGPLFGFLDNVRQVVNEIRTGYTANKADYAAGRAEVVKLVTDLTATRAEVAKLVTDATALRVTVVALIADMATRIANHNTLTTKLNADAGVTDTNYAAAGAITAVDGGVITAAAPAAVTAVAPAAVTTSALAESALQLTKT